MLFPLFFHEATVDVTVSSPDAPAPRKSKERVIHSLAEPLEERSPKFANRVGAHDSRLSDVHAAHRAHIKKVSEMMIHRKTTVRQLLQLTP